MAAETRVHLSSLNGLRGIAACIVVCGHILVHWTLIGNPDGDTYPIFGLDHLSPVTLFIVVSGFTLVCVYNKYQPAQTEPCLSPGESAASEALAGGRGSPGSGHGVSKRPGFQFSPDSVASASAATDAGALQKDSPPPFSAKGSVKLFLRRRVARLLPIYYLGLVLDVVPLIVYFKGVALAVSIPSSLLLLQSLTGVGSAWNSPLWTISTFAACYLWFPRLLRGLRSLSTAALQWWLFILLSSSALVAALWLPQANGWKAGYFMHIFFLFRIPQFAAGMVGALLVQRAPLRSPVPILWICSLALTAELLACALATGLTSGTSRIRVFFTFTLYAEYFIPGVFVAFLAALASPAAQSTLLVRVLASRPLNYLGDISYALYCTHWPVLVWSAWAVAGKGVSNDAVPRQNFPDSSGVGGWNYFPGWAIFILLPVTLIVAALAHHALESPARAKIGGKCS